MKSIRPKSRMTNPYEDQLPYSLRTQSILLVARLVHQTLYEIWEGWDMCSTFNFRLSLCTYICLYQSFRP